MPKPLPLPISVRASDALTDAWVSTSPVAVHNGRRVDWTIRVSETGSATRLDARVQVATAEDPGDADWSTVQTEAVAAGVATLSDYELRKDLSAALTLGIGLDTRGRWMRLQIKAGTGDPAGSACSVEALVS